MPKGTPISPELKAKMAEGRRRAAAERVVAREAMPEISEPERLPTPILEPEDVLDYGLTAAEEAEVRRAAREKIEAERRDKARKARIREIQEEERRAAGAVPVDEVWRSYMEEPVRVYVEMPRMRKAPGMGEHEPEPIIIDGKIFRSGQWYTLPRAEAVYLMDVADKNRRHAAQAEGHSRTYYHNGTSQMVFQGGTAVGGPPGPSFDAIHRRPQ